MTQYSDEVRAFLEATSGPRRRARPRTAAALAEAEHRIIDGVAAWRSGPGPAVLLVHGWEDDHSLWDPLIAGFDQIARPVVAIDLPGHGFSPAEMGTVLDVADKLAVVARDFGPIDSVVAHSYGGPCTVAAIETTDFAPSRVVLIAAPVVQREQIAYRAQRYGAPEGAIQAMIERLEQATGRSVDWFDLRRAARAMTAAGMVVHSLDDEVCPVEQVQAVAAAWAGCELLLTDGMGHRDVARDASVVARIVDFIG